MDLQLKGKKAIMAGGSAGMGRATAERLAEAGVDLARLAGCEPAGVIVEILNEDGSMARRPQLEEFAKKHDIKLGTIAGLELEETKIFSFDRDNTIKELVDRASSRHYSAFFLYEQEEFDYALSKFKDNLEANYPDSESVKWLDEKILYIIKKT